MFYFGLGRGGVVGGFFIILQPEPRKTLSSSPDIYVTQAHTESERNVEISGEVMFVEASVEW